MSINPTDIVNELLRDPVLKMVDKGRDLHGVCPECGKKEAYINKEKPFMLKCRRDNKCGFTESTRDRYPDLFIDLSKRIPATEQDPNATARAYLENRGFNPAKLIDCYSQELRTFKAQDGSNVYAPVVRFPFLNGHWDRIIDETNIDLIGKKANISWKLEYKGQAWQHPKQKTLKKNSRVFITEGIFHAIAFYHLGEQHLAAISSSNFPRNIIKQNLNKGIEWVMAYDDDAAGHKYIRKYLKELKTLGERGRVALTGSNNDWDDILKTGKLDQTFIEESLWRGDLFSAQSVQEKAFYLYLKNNRATHILDFNNRLYQVRINTDKLNEDLATLAESTNQTDIEQSPEERKKPAVDLAAALATNDGKKSFNNYCKVEAISNCYPVFLYCEADKITQEIAYYFEIRQPQNPTQQVGFQGSALESPASFNKNLLNKAAGATFDGDVRQLKQIRDGWFNGGIDRVETVPFIGYDKSTQIYVYPNFAICNGRQLTLNEYNYFTHGKHRIKTSFKGFNIVEGETFDPNWLGDYHKTFHWNGLVVLAFWLGSLLAEQIRERHASYPFLEMSGLPGTGKSTVLEFLWRCLGRDDYEGFDPSKATFAARTRAFIQASNMPVALIEGDREKDSKKGGFDYNELKTAYNGRSVRAMGAFNRGNEIIEPPFRGSILIAQNAEVDAEPAVLERIVSLNFTKNHFNAETKKLSKQFERTSCKQLAGFLPAVLEKENALLAKFDIEFSRLEKQYTTNEHIKNQRVIKNHAMIAALGYCLADLFPSMTAERCETLSNFIEQKGTEREKRLVTDNPLIQQFFEVYHTLEDGLAGDKGNTQVNHSSETNTIAINLAHFYQMANIHRLDLPRQSEIKPLLKASVNYKYIESNKTTYSALNAKSLRCWIFKTKG